MYLVLGLLASLLISIQAQVVDDFNCTYVSPVKMKLTFTPTSVKCNDKLTPAQCAVYFPTDPVVPDDDTKARPPQCYSSLGAAPIEVPVQKMATEYCPKHCGYCCLTDAYSCQNKQNPAINCDTVTDAMCDDPAWRQIIADNCPNKCGMCQMGGCIDKAVDCAADPSICNNMNVQPFVNENCQRTCNRCNGTGTASTTASPGGGTGCSDSSTSCATWKTNGFCTNTFYTNDQKKQYCGRTCGLC
ncbi:hypothetical protein WR25_09137 [Diploscapter pachys]|uniref:ShKT domain-containing protein n=1 Tax=Diploscapter pachys TaxID=2018661 RepID=A0A2A2LIK6_9BILA|nr:hypothetical protein WR25_09137 [Diploscapter pachys]